MDESNVPSSASSGQGQDTPDSVDASDLDQQLDDFNLNKLTKVLAAMAGQRHADKPAPVINDTITTTTINEMADSLPEEDRRQTVDFFLAWEHIIVHEDNCFLLTDDERSTAAFTSRMNGQTPEEFALAALERDVEVFAHAKALHGAEDYLPHVMLRFWKQRSRMWRAQFRSKEEAREDFEQRRQDLDLLPELFKRRVDRNATGQLSLGVCKVAVGEQGHVCTVYVVPALEEYYVVYETQGITYCHQDCQGKLDIDALLKDKLDEQYEGDLKLLLAAKGIEDPEFK